RTGGGSRTGRTATERALRRGSIEHPGRTQASVPDRSLHQRWDASLRPREQPGKRLLAVHGLRQRLHRPESHVAYRLRAQDSTTDTVQDDLQHVPTAVGVRAIVPSENDGQVEAPRGLRAEPAGCGGRGGTEMPGDDGIEWIVPAQGVPCETNRSGRRAREKAGRVDD